MGKVDVERLMALAEKATPGPRHWSKCGMDAIPDDGHLRCVLWAEYDADVGGNVNCSKADAQFIESCDPQTIISLIEEVRKARAGGVK